MAASEVAPFPVGSKRSEDSFAPCRILCPDCESVNLAIERYVENGWGAAHLLFTIKPNHIITRERARESGHGRVLKPDSFRVVRDHSFPCLPGRSEWLRPPTTHTLGLD